MSLTLMNEKAIRKIVRPRLEAAYPAQVEKAEIHSVVDFIAHTNPHRLATAVPNLARQLAYAYGESEKNRTVAVQLLTAVFHDEDY